jgi:hypothetical protein
MPAIHFAPIFDSVGQEEVWRRLKILIGRKCLRIAQYHQAIICFAHQESSLDIALSTESPS